MATDCFIHVGRRLPRAVWEGFQVNRPRRSVLALKYLDGRSRSACAGRERHRPQSRTHHRFWANLIGHLKPLKPPSDGLAGAELLKIQIRYQPRPQARNCVAVENASGKSSFACTSLDVFIRGWTWLDNRTQELVSCFGIATATASILVFGFANLEPKICHFDLLLSAYRDRGC